jgi:hypothetical protein
LAQPRGRERSPECVGAASERLPNPEHFVSEPILVLLARNGSFGVRSGSRFGGRHDNHTRVGCQARRPPRSTPCLGPSGLWALVRPLADRDT